MGLSGWLSPHLYQLQLLSRSNMMARPISLTGEMLSSSSSPWPVFLVRCIGSELGSSPRGPIHIGSLERRRDPPFYQSSLVTNNTPRSTGLFQDQVTSKTVTGFADILLPSLTFGTREEHFQAHWMVSPEPIIGLRMDYVPRSSQRLDSKTAAVELFETSLDYQVPVNFAPF